MSKWRYKARLQNTPISKKLLSNTKLSEEESSKLIAKLRSNQENNALVYVPDTQTLSGEDITYESINDLLNRDGYKDDSKSVHRLAITEQEQEAAKAADNGIAEWITPEIKTSLHERSMGQTSFNPYITTADTQWNQFYRYSLRRFRFPRSYESNIGSNLQGMQVNDSLIGTTKTDTLEGGDGDDTLVSMGGQLDQLNGNKGDNILVISEGTKDAIINFVHNDKQKELIGIPEKYKDSFRIQRSSRELVSVELINHDTGKTVANALIIGDYEPDQFTSLLGDSDYIAIVDNNYQIIDYDDLIPDSSPGIDGYHIIEGTSNADQISPETKDPFAVKLDSSNEIYGRAKMTRFGKKHDLIYGNDGHDQINGGKGDDSLFGNQGNDTIDGGTQGAVVEGGEGQDQFMMTTGSIFISDFDPEEDRIALKDRSKIHS